MRIPAVLLVLALAVASCSNDASDSAPTTSSTSSTTSTTSITTTTTISTTTTTTTTTTTGAVSVPSTTDPERFEAFTTNEMKDALAGSHVYLGGSILDADLVWAVEQWGVGAGDDVVEWYEVGGEMELWVSKLLHRTEEGISVWNRRDVVVTRYRPEDGWAFSARCRLGGEPTDGVFAWYPVGDGSDPWTPAVEAWRVDFDSGRAAPINAGVVDCENEAWGV